MAAQTRARFLGASAATVGGAALAGAWRAGSAEAATAAADDGTVTEGAFDPRFSGDTFSFELAGAAAGRMLAPEGGKAVADVVTEKIGPDNIAKKHIGNVKYEEVTFRCGTGMSKGFYEWMKASFDRKATHQTGAIVGFDQAGQATGRGTFTNGLITEIGFPALDAASKDAAKMTITFSPEKTSFLPATGKAPAGGGAIPEISAGNFKLAIDGLDTTKVVKIDAITIKQNFIQHPVDELHDYEKEPTSVEIPNLVVTFPERQSMSWSDYHEDFVIRGHNGDDNEKSGSLVYLDKNGTSLFTLTFFNLGLFKLTPEKVASSAQTIRQIRAEMYCEDIRFDYSAAAAFH